MATGGQQPPDDDNELADAVKNIRLLNETEQDFGYTINFQFQKTYFRYNCSDIQTQTKT